MRTDQIPTTWRGRLLLVLVYLWHRAGEWRDFLRGRMPFSCLQGHHDAIVDRSDPDRPVLFCPDCRRVSAGWDLAADRKRPKRTQDADRQALKVPGRIVAIVYDQDLEDVGLAPKPKVPKAPTVH